jgi:PIN domain nuclease of toxin-antitoxin system
VIQLSTPIILDSTSLPGTPPRDPADQLIVATSRVLDIELLSADSEIRAYAYVRLAK